MDKHDDDLREGASAPFNPWTATAESMRALMSTPEAWVDGGPLIMYGYAQAIAVKRKQIENGSGRAVLDAVAHCIAVGLPVVDWLAEAFLNRYNTVHYAEAESWDDEGAFGPANPPKGLALRRSRILWGEVIPHLFDGAREGSFPRTKPGRDVVGRMLGMPEKHVNALIPKTRAYFSDRGRPFQSDRGR